MTFQSSLQVSVQRVDQEEQPQEQVNGEVALDRSHPLHPPIKKVGWLEALADLFQAKLGRD